MMKIGTKLIIAFMAMGLIPFTIIGMISLVNSSDALTESVFGQLESIREVKKTQIGNYFSEIEKDMAVLMDTVSSLQQAAFAKLNSVQENKKAQVRALMAKSVSDIAVISQNATVIQALTDFEGVIDTKGDIDTELYDFFESVKYGNSFTQFKKEFGYYDLMLVSSTGYVVYSVNRESDLGKHVLTGELMRSGLGRCFKEALKRVHIEDFSAYRPSGNRHMAFLGAPVIEKFGSVLGTVILKISNNRLNDIVQRRQGMGQTGETYIVGRSTAKITYRSDRLLRKTGIGEAVYDSYFYTAHLKTTGPEIITRPEGRLVIVRYDPLEIPGLDWTLVTSMDIAEAIVPRGKTGEPDYFNKYITAYGYGNLYLITADGHLFYAASPGPEQGTNLINGEFTGTGLGRLFSKVMASGMLGFVDYAAYAPAEDMPSGFVGQPLLQKGQPELVVAVQLPFDPINTIMLERAGMGKTGETYLVGPDLRMRSDSYLDPERYSVQACFADPERCVIDTPSIRMALAGTTAEAEARDYRNEPVLSAYTPVTVFDTNWALIAEIDRAEALEGLKAFKIMALVVAILAVAAILAVSMLIARHLARPVAKLTAGAEQVRARNFDIEVIVDSNDELELLAETFNAMVSEMRDYARDLEQKVDLLREADAELRQSEERLRQLANATWEAIVIHDEGMLLHANDQFYGMFGFTKAELEGKYLIPIIMDPESAEVATRRIAKKELTPYEAVGRAKDGRKIPMEIRIRMMNYQGRRVRVAAIRDMSRHHRAEVEKARLEAQLRQSHKMEAIGTLAGGIAHDFNNILGIIIGNCELALYDIPEWNPGRNCLEEIKTAGLRAKDVVRQLLSFSRKSEQAKKPVDVVPIVEEVLRLMRSSIPSTTNIKPFTRNSCPAIMADPSQIHQVLINLCTNASHAMEDAGGTLQIEVSSTHLTESMTAGLQKVEPGMWVTITVMDTGHGIAPDAIDRIFDPYYTTKAVDKGTGMGLSVVHGIVSDHGGKTLVESEPEVGTRFTLYFPAIDLVAETEGKLGADLPRGNERILLVDDEKALVEMGRLMLERLGYRVHSETDPRKALEVFRTDPDSFDLVLTDMTMPMLTGIDLARAIFAVRPRFPIIICTGFSLKVDETSARQMGIKGYIMKPLILREIASLLRETLDGSER